MKIDNPQKRFLIVGIIIIVGIIFFWVFNNFQKYNSQNNNSAIENKKGEIIDENFNIDKEKIGERKILAKGLQIEILQEGNGPRITEGQTAVVNYIGKLENGTEFDSSYKRGTPFSFVLGAGRVIRGWEMGILGMQIGEKRKLIISPELGYGSQQIGIIPPNSTLVFEVELLEIK